MDEVVPSVSEPLFSLPATTPRPFGVEEGEAVTVNGRGVAGVECKRGVFVWCGVGMRVGERERETKDSTD